MSINSHHKQKHQITSFYKSKKTKYEPRDSTAEKAVLMKEENMRTRTDQPERAPLGPAVYQAV